MSDLSKETLALLEEGVLGKEVADFMKSDVGQYLVAHIDAESAEGYKELRDTSPSNTQAIMEAQNKVHRAESMKQWLVSAIMAGLHATEILESREDD